MNGLRAPLRLAYRDALRAKGRTALVLAMIGLPVAAVTVLSHVLGAVHTGNATADHVDSSAQAADFAVYALVAAMAVLQVVLLAGPAFAVGLRRQRLLLAQLAAAGGTPGHLRAVVLSAGLLLGAAAAVLGTAAGLLVSAVLRPALSDGMDFAPWRFDVTQIAVTAAVAVLSGLAAAYSPARQAGRTDPAAVLAGRRDEPRASRGLPVLGIVLIGAGLVFTKMSLWSLREWGPALGAVPVILGFVLLAPTAVALCARLAGPLPLPLRLAVRDAGRHRGRTAPAVAAITAAVAAFTALGVGLVSDTEQRRLEYHGTVAEGHTVVGDLRPDTAVRVRAALEAAVPEGSVHEVVGLDESGPDLSPQCSCVTTGPAWELRLGSRHFVGGPEVLRYLLGRDDPAATAALARGEAVALVPNGLEGGELRLEYADFPEDGSEGPSKVPVREMAFPAVQVTAYLDGPIAVLPPSLAEKTGLPSHTSAFVVTSPLDEEATAALARELRPFGAAVMTERGYRESIAMPALVLGGVAAFLVLAAALIATGLAAADSRPDLATLTAVGARPRTVRLIRLAQSAYITLLGCALGILAGLPPGIAVTRPLTANQETSQAAPHGVITEIPWSLLAAVCLGTPLLVAALTALTTRTTIPPARHLT
ncbi:hypothetical protein GCM10022221_03550 [Actinocorallia aurea]